MAGGAGEELVEGGPGGVGGKDGGFELAVGLRVGVGAWDF